MYEAISWLRLLSRWKQEIKYICNGCPNMKVLVFWWWQLYFFLNYNLLTFLNKTKYLKHLCMVWYCTFRFESLLLKEKNLMNNLIKKTVIAERELGSTISNTPVSCIWTASFLELSDTFSYTWCTLVRYIYVFGRLGFVLQLIQEYFSQLPIQYHMYSEIVHFIHLMNIADSRELY